MATFRDILGTPGEDQLALADGRWILGHWYVKVICNGRSVGDFTSLAGMLQEELGQTRAWFQILEDRYGLVPLELEHGRQADDVLSPEALDAPPESWADFVATATIAELALLSLSEAIKERAGDDEEVAGLLEKSFQEEFFHQLLVTGWLHDLGAREAEDAAQALRRRLPLLLRWLGPASGSSRDALADARARFLERARTVLGEAGFDAGELVEAARAEAEAAGWENWEPHRRREAGSRIPARLWEFVVPTNEAALRARRPRSVALADDFSTTIEGFSGELEERAVVADEE